MNVLRAPLIAATLAAALAIASSSRADYYATVIVDFTMGISDLIRLDEVTGQPVAGFDFHFPSGTLTIAESITVGPNEFLYVSDSGTGNILQVNPHTGDATMFAQLPPIQFVPTFVPREAAGARFSPGGNLFVASRNDDNVYEIDGLTGGIVNTIPLPEGTAPSGIDFNRDGNLLVTSLTTGLIYEVVGGVPEVFIPPVQMLVSPTGVLATADGRTWVTDVPTNSLRLYASDGAPAGPPLTIPPTIPNPLPPGADFPSNSPAEITFDNEGNILLATLGLVEQQGALFRVERPQGDFNGDMLVDGQDLDVWRGRFGAAPLAGNFDGNGDGIFDAADYTIWRDTRGAIAQFVTIRSGTGESFSSIVQYTPDGALGAAVPEPSTLLAMVVGVGVGVTRIRRRP